MAYCSFVHLLNIACIGTKINSRHRFFNDNVDLFNEGAGVVMQTIKTNRIRLAVILKR